ncbi:octanoyltransferase [Paenibacillus durus ATCC 35681]|uniref:Octanoyltransferase n=1 Tax=Paenibacillus durus ATCC 35681 TaxID=1333534 RepID=A0A0F7FBB0_PAEDU|nr:lipoyl(octanoyl) transferase LipB [Paenibacillus durus]AKG35497.1 octanoyltransferase [Paenibacillus durus ATCC 35681]
MDSIEPRKLEISYFPMIEYSQAWHMQKESVRAIDAGERLERLILLQHPPTYTIGSQNHPEHLLLNADQLREEGISLFEIDRGGDITYHGPGQLVGYPLLRIGEQGRVDLHGYLRSLEQVIIDYLATFGIEGGRKPEYTGVWVGNVKICAIGVKFNKSRTRKGFLTSHGFAFNIREGIAEEGFRGIIPCGISQYGVTSLEECTGRRFEIEEVAAALVPHFLNRFPYDGIESDWAKATAGQ